MSDARGQHEETRLPEFPLYALPILRFGRSVEIEWFRQVSVISAPQA